MLPPGAGEQILLGLILVLGLKPAEGGDPSGANKMTGAGQVAYHPRMSCYACTTMDYESPTDNICRSIKPHNRAPTNLHQQPSGHLHFSHQIPATTSTTTSTTTTTTTTSSSSTVAGSEPETQEAATAGDVTSALVWSPGHADLPTTPASPPYYSTPRFGPHGDMKHVNNNNNAGVSTTSLSPLAASTTSAAAQEAHKSRSASNRTMFPSNYIRTRPCLEDENFCSIVSVVRIEFVQENFYSKFWALERNCSKSCNTGCMVIGERVRLRVCSQCCRTPNCNVGNSASNSSRRPVLGHTTGLQLVVLLLSIAASCFLFAGPQRA